MVSLGAMSAYPSLGACPGKQDRTRESSHGEAQLPGRLPPTRGGMIWILEGHQLSVLDFKTLRMHPQHNTIPMSREHLYGC